MSTLSAFAAFMTFPLTFRFPLMNSFWAFALPSTNFWKFSSDKASVTSLFSALSGLLPFPTLPSVLRSSHHDSSAPSAFLRVKVKVALACLMACWRVASLPRESAMVSKMEEAGKAAGEGG